MNDLNFTKIFSKWLNIFINDLDSNKEKVLEKLENFPGDKDIVKKAILDIDSLDKTSEEIATEVFKYIEYYATGQVHPIEVKYAKK